MADSSADKRRRLIATATVLFSRYGFKRTSVDMLAREASVAKPTVYAYFADKDAVFRAVVEAVCDDLLAVATEASATDASIEERLTAVLAAKFTRYWELVQASPHARELIESQGSMGAAIIEKADRAFLKLLVSVIDEANELNPNRVGMTSTTVARLLLRTAAGAAYDATTLTSHRKHLAEAVRVIVIALRKRQ